jgi:uncharacterized protein YutE (UPF0331/DUF86 family)
MTDSPHRENFEARIARAGLLSALLERVGYTFWQLAECEDAVAYYLVFRLKATKGIGLARGNELLENAQRRTFGSLIHELTEHGVLDGTVESRLAGLLDDRNWLVHRSKRESRGVLFRSADFERLVARLDRIAAEASAVQKLVVAATEDYLIASGVNRSEIDAAAEKSVQSWGYV